MSALCLSVLWSGGSGLSQERRDATGCPASRLPREVTCCVLDWKGVEKLIAAQQGRVVVVDLWSTYCVPCLREFPHLVALQKEHQEQVACISVNVNYAGIKPAPSPELQREVLKFLKKKRARLRNVISSVPDEKLAEQLDYASIPIVYVYDRQGKLRKRFDNEQAEKPEDEFTYKRDVIPLVERLLAEESP